MLKSILIALLFFTCLMACSETPSDLKLSEDEATIDSIAESAVKEAALKADSVFQLKNKKEAALQQPLSGSGEGN